MSQCTLSFVSGPQIELIQSDFVRVDGSRYLTIRGKTAGAYRGAGTFQWTTAVKGLCCVLLKAQLASHGVAVDPIVRGGAGSLAASFDYAISKETTWLCEMFGVGTNGRSISRRMFLISNPNRKRPGPVQISLNQKMLDPTRITILLDGKVVTAVEVIARIMNSIEDEHQSQDLLKAA